MPSLYKYVFKPIEINRHSGKQSKCMHALICYKISLNIELKKIRLLDASHVYVMSHVFTFLHVFVEKNFNMAEIRMVRCIKCYNIIG